MSSINNLISSTELGEELERLSTIVMKPKGSILLQRGDISVAIPKAVAHAVGVPTHTS